MCTENCSTCIFFFSLAKTICVFLWVGFLILLIAMCYWSHLFAALCHIYVCIPPCAMRSLAPTTWKKNNSREIDFQYWKSSRNGICFLIHYIYTYTWFAKMMKTIYQENAHNPLIRLNSYFEHLLIKFIDKDYTQIFVQI